MESDFFNHLNHFAVVCVMMTGLYVLITHVNLIKKVIGLVLFQTSIFILFISLGKVDGGTAPLLTETHSVYSSPLPHVLILTAIVVGIATTALALALVVRIHRAFGSMEEDKIRGSLSRPTSPPGEGQE